MKKYEITDIAHPDNPNLHRIRAVTDLTEDVLAGMLGGYVESCDNLDQDGRAWISEDAIACENAVVCGDAILTDISLRFFYLFAGQRLRVAQTDAWADLSNLLDSLHSQPEAKAIHTQTDQ